MADLLGVTLGEQLLLPVASAVCIAGRNSPEPIGGGRRRARRKCVTGSGIADQILTINSTIDPRQTGV